MSTLDVNGLIADLQAFKMVVARHMDELIKDPNELEAARHVAYKGQVLPLLRDETNALNFQYNTYKIYLSDLGKEAAPSRKLCIDFDHTLSKGHQGDQMDGPFDGAIEALQKLKVEGYEIVIYSCRANSDHGRKQIEEWLKKYNCPYDEIFIGKPEAMAYVDDRAIPFKGNWAEVLKDIGASHDAELNKSTSVSIFLSIPSSTDNQLSCREGETSRPLSAREVSSAFLPSLPGVVWEVHDGPDMQHSPSTPLEMLHPVNEWNTYDSYTAIHDKKDPTDLLHFLSLEDIEKKPDQSSDAKEEDEANEAQDNIESSLGKRDIAKRAATNEEHLAHIKELVNQRQFEKAVAYLNDNKLNAPKLLKDLEDRSSKATILNKEQALLLIEKGSQGAQSNAVKWLAKNNNVNELAAAVPLVAFNPSVAKEIIDVFKANKNVIVLNRLYANTSIPEAIRRDIVEILVGINYIPIIDEAIKDDSEQIRSAGYRAAARLKAKDHLLEEGTKDPSAKVRKEVYGYLWEAQTPAAMDLFYKGQKDSDPSIQNFVKEKVGLSKGQTVAPTPKGDELTKKMIEDGITDAEEYFKKHPELGEKLKKELEEREKTMQYNRSLVPSAPKKSSLDKEAIQPPAGMTMAIEPAFEWGERDDGLLAKDVKQYYGRPKTEWRNNLGLLPEFLKKMEDDKMEKEADFFPSGSFFQLKDDLRTAEGKFVLPKGHKGLVLWRDPTVPSIYVVRFEGIETNDGDIGIPENIMEPFATPKTAASNVYDDFEQTAVDDERRMERTEDDEGVLIMDRDWISDTQTFPRGVPSPPARWVINDDEREGEAGKPGVGGTKLRNGPTYWEPSPGNLDGMPAGQSFSSLTAEVDNDGARVTCSWDNENSEQEITAALVSFIKVHLPHVFDKFKSISSEHVDLPNRTLVLKFQGDKEHNEKK